MRLMMKRDIGRMWGQTQAQIGGLCRIGNPLYEALSRDKIDVHSGAYRLWASKQGYYHNDDDELIPITDENYKPDQAETDYHNANAMVNMGQRQKLDRGDIASIEEIMGMPLRSILSQFGDEPIFSAWLKDIKTLEDIREKRLRNQQTEGAIVSREGVKQHVLGLLEELSRRLLMDATKTLTRRVYGMANSSVPIEDAEKEVRKIIEMNLKKAKEGTTRKLRKL